MVAVARKAIAALVEAPGLDTHVPESLSALVDHAAADEPGRHQVLQITPGQGVALTDRLAPAILGHQTVEGIGHVE